jgi:methylated-DNA-[protein]-cysteine S-methyltransferase
MDSIIGRLYLSASDEGLEWVTWHKQEIPSFNNDDYDFKETFSTSAITSESSQRETYLAQAVSELTEYFEGYRTHFDVTLTPPGTEFQRRVWQALCDIPYGQTRSYKDIAISIQNAKATRAVGSANGKNPIAIIIPCHRVIASDGTIGGYAGGLNVKKILLSHEKRQRLQCLEN